MSIEELLRHVELDPEDDEAVQRLQRALLRRVNPNDERSLERLDSDSVRVLKEATLIAGDNGDWRAQHGPQGF